MKATLPNLKKLAGRGRTENDLPTPEATKHTQEPAEPKPPPPLSLFFMLSHLEDDGPVRLDRVKLAVMEVMGLELDEPKLGSLRRIAERPGLPGATAGAPAPAGVGEPSESRSWPRPSPRTCRNRPATPPSPWDGC